MTTSDITQLAGAIARTVKVLRAGRGWSLDQLSARSGVSKGVLVALEQGGSNPNLATLAKLSDAFGVPVTQLVEVGEEPAVRVGDVSRVMWHGPAGGTGTLVGATSPPWATELWHWEVLPGESFGGDAHAPGTRELIWIESGSLTLSVDGEPHQADAGESAQFPGHLPHHYSNSGNSAARFIMLVVVPPVNDLHSRTACVLHPASRRLPSRAAASHGPRQRNRVHLPCRGRAPERSPPPGPALRAAPCVPVPGRGTSRGSAVRPRPRRRR